MDERRQAAASGLSRTARRQVARTKSSAKSRPRCRRVVNQLHALEDARKDGEIPLPNGDRLKVTNLAKLFWPKLKITKGDLLRYYVEVSPYVLPASPIGRW